MYTINKDKNYLSSSVNGMGVGAVRYSVDEGRGYVAVQGFVSPVEVFYLSKEICHIYMEQSLNFYMNILLKAFTINFGPQSFLLPGLIAFLK